MSDNVQYVAGKRYQLAGSGITSTATSITVNNLFLPNPAATPITMAMFGTIGFATLEPATSKIELISFLGITDNGDDSFTLTGVTRGLDFKAPYTTVPANKLAHSGGSILIFSNSPQLYDNFANKNNDETITQSWTFTNPNVPRMDGSHTYIAGEEEFFATKRYVDGVAVAGVANASTTQKGIVQEATAAQIDAGTATGSTGARLFMNPNQWQAGSTYALIPTQGQKNALVGDDTSIAVGTTNKYVTQTGAQNQGETYAVSTGGSTGYILTYSPVPVAYVAGQTFKFLAHTASGNNPVVNINGLGSKTLLASDGSTALLAGNIAGSQIAVIAFNGSRFQLVSPKSSSSANSLAGALINDAQSTTTTTDTVFTTTFLPKTIVLHYALDGLDDSGVIEYTTGIATFDGTVLQSNMQFGNNTAAGNVTQAGVTVVNTGALAGGTDANNAMRVVISIVNLSATGFTVRLTYTKGALVIEAAHAKIGVAAFS